MTNKSEVPNINQCVKQARQSIIPNINKVGAEAEPHPGNTNLLPEIVINDKTQPQ